MLPSSSRGWATRRCSLPPSLSERVLRRRPGRRTRAPPNSALQPTTPPVGPSGLPRGLAAERGDVSPSWCQWSRFVNRCWARWLAERSATRSGRRSRAGRRTSRVLCRVASRRGRSPATCFVNILLDMNLPPAWVEFPPQSEQRPTTLDRARAGAPAATDTLHQVVRSAFIDSSSEVEREGGAGRTHREPGVGDHLVVP